MPSLMSRLTGWLGGPARARLALPAPHAKASAAGPLIALHSQGMPVWTPRDFSGFAREGFARNPVVYRCVRMISEAAGSLAWLAYEEERELSEHPLLALLAGPNPRQSGPEFLEAVYGHLLISGNAYVEAVAVEGQVRELHALRPDRMKVVPGADGWPEAYEYQVGAERLRFSAARDGAVRPVMHLALFHPADDHYGLSPLEAAAVSVDLHNAAGGWNKALLDNSARPSGALVYTPAEPGMALTREQYDRLKAELETGFQGAANAGRPLLLEGGLDWKSMGLSPKELDFVETRNAAARDIALAFGVPPMLLGIPGDNTYANYQEANRALWRQTVLPHANRLAKALGLWLGPAFGGRLRLAVDADQIEALSTEREALWKRAGQAGFLTLNEKRAAIGYGPVEGGDAPPPASGSGGHG